MTTWIERRTSDLIDGLRAGVSVRSVSGEAGGPAVLKTSAIKSGRFDPRESKPILLADLPRAKCPVVADSIIISRMNTPALVGDVGYVEKDVDSLFLPDRLWIARSKRGSGTDIRWLTYHFSSQAGARALRELATGTSGSMKNIPKDKVLGLKVLTPTPPEQRAIADALTDAENLISSLERLTAKKQAIKQGMMQELLTGRRRLQGFSKSWQATTFGDLVRIQRGSVLTRAQAGSGRIPVVAGGKTPAGYTDKANRVGRTITISASGASAGYVALYNEPIFASDCSTISSSRHYDLDFIYYCLLLRQDDIYRAQTGGAQPHIHACDVYPMEIRVPTDMQEQIAIAQVLVDADKEIMALERRLESARGIKQGMMQELLTGRTKLVSEGVR